MSRQKVPGDLGFSRSFEPVTARPSGPVVVQPRRSSTAILGVKPWLIVIGALMASVFIFGILKLLSSAGGEIARHNNDVLSQVDHAKDADAQASAQATLLAARTIFASDASYAGVSPASLAQTEPSFRYTSGPSTDSKVVSVSASATKVGVAVSAGKTCWYLVDSGTSATTFGSGTGACTGDVALRLATAAAW